MNKLFCIIFKTFPDSMQLLVNPKFLSLKGFSYPEEGAKYRVPLLTGTWFERRTHKPTPPKTVLTPELKFITAQCIREFK